ncbi:MAG: EI24 domain-containing protein [Tepidiphilus sp.]|jgi:uncharacterized protein involved in cysteine biosynthesis|nr:EI24 domain-containing protein [Tepidiphilus sp.]MDK2797223.1 CysZ protein [Tepidiphilus sp.]
MDLIRIALLRSLATLGRGKILWEMFWPLLAAGLVWIAALALAWEPLTAWLAGWFDASPEGAQAGMLAMAGFFALKVLLVLGVLPLMYVTLLVIVGIWVMPRVVALVGREEYADLERRHGGSVMRSLWNTLGASGLFLVGFLVSLIFWWIPGAALVLPWLLTAWLNKRTFSYDCLMEHADAEELRALEAREGGTFFWLGAIGAALAYVPLLNLFAPALTGLLFVHAGLEALRRLRLERGAWIVEMDLPKGKR